MIDVSVTRMLPPPVNREGGAQGILPKPQTLRRDIGGVGVIVDHPFYASESVLEPGAQERWTPIQ